VARPCPYWAEPSKGGQPCALAAGHSGIHRDATGREFSSTYAVREHGESEDDRLAGRSADEGEERNDD